MFKLVSYSALNKGMIVTPGHIKDQPKTFCKHKGVFVSEWDFQFEIWELIFVEGAITWRK